MKGLGAEEYHSVEPSRFLSDMEEANLDKVVILAMDISRIVGSRIPDEYVFENYVEKDPDKFIGFSGIDPLSDDGRLNRKALLQLERSVKEFGFRGMKLMPAFGHYYPNDARVYVFYEKAVDLDIPVMFHQSSSHRAAPLLKYARPYLLDEVAYDFPELRIIAAHMGYPWSEELIALMRKQPNVYGDISGSLLRRPLLLAWTLAMAKEYDVQDRVLFGTDYPGNNPRKALEWCGTQLNKIAKKSGYPTWSKEEIDGLLGGNAMKLLAIE